MVDLSGSVRLVFILFVIVGKSLLKGGRIRGGRSLEGRRSFEEIRYFQTA